MDMKVEQFGESLTGNLSEGTWTFEVEDLELRAGIFAIVRKDYYQKLKKNRSDLLDALITVKDILESPKLIDAGDLRRIVNEALDSGNFS